MMLPSCICQGGTYAKWLGLGEGCGKIAVLHGMGMEKEKERKATAANKGMAEELLHSGLG